MPDPRYLDHAATTPLRAGVHEAMAPYLDEHHGNPSGVHGFSRTAKNAIEEAREVVADLLGARRPLEIVFTGGGTESDNLAVAGAALAGGGRGGVVTVATEHDAVLSTTHFLRRLGCDTRIVGVDRTGAADPGAVAAAVGSDTAVVSVMAANNETGVIHPVAAITAAVRETGLQPAVHTDAVQAFASEEITVDALGGAELISLSAHKFGGPKGTGVLRVAEGVDLEPVIHGGGQELGRRSGTHDVAGIVGLTAAMAMAVEDRHVFAAGVGAARDGFEMRLRARLPDVEVTAAGARRLPQHSHVRFPGLAAETLLIRLDQVGIAAAAGSACHSGAIDISHVLDAMGMEAAAAAECVRFTFGWPHQPGDGPELADLVTAVVLDLREAA